MIGHADPTVAQSNVRAAIAPTSRHPCRRRLLGTENSSLRSPRADQAIGRLAGEGRRLPNPHLFIRPFLRREAVLSSRIEGTQTTLGELLAAQAGARVEQSSADLREVANYVVALEFGIQRLNTLPLSLRLVRELHEKLMRGVRGDTATPGEFRRSQNWIGPPGCVLNNATYIPPPPEELMACLGEWENFLHDDTLPPSDTRRARSFSVRGHSSVLRREWTRWSPAHHAAIRRPWRPASTASVLERLFRSHARGVLRTPAGDNSKRAVGGVADLLPAHGVALQAEDAIGRIQRIDELFQHWSEQLTGTAIETIGEGVGAVCRKPLLDRERNCTKASGRLYHGPTRPRSTGIGRHRHADWRGETQPSVLRPSHARSTRGTAQRRTSRNDDA